MYTRREFGLLTLAGLVPLRLKPDTTDAGSAALGLDSVISGVRIGAQTYSFRDLPRTPDGDAIDPVIKAMMECGLTECELFAPQVEPRQPETGRGGGRGGARSPEAEKARADLRKWRLETSLDHFRDQPAVQRHSRDCPRR